MSVTKQKTAAKTISDAIGLSHFLIANLIYVLGMFTGLFKFMEEKRGAIAFIKTYLSAPAIPVLSAILTAYEHASNAFLRGVTALTGGSSDPSLSGAAGKSVYFADRFFTDTSFWGLFLSTEAIIIVASIIYWGLCYLSVRLILSLFEPE